MFFVGDIGSFHRSLSDKISSLRVKSTKLLQVLQCRAAAFLQEAAKMFVRAA